MGKVIFPDVCLRRLQAFHDERGHFLELFRQNQFAGLHGAANGVAFVQDNLSVSRQGVLRGLHYQKTLPQGKLVQVLSGDIFDVVVDVRAGSATFGCWQGFSLSASAPSQLWVPPGYAHGFVVLSVQAMVLYKCTAYYQPDDEVALRWNDAEVGIVWPWQQPVLSAKDSAAFSLHDIRQKGLAV